MSVSEKQKSLVKLEVLCTIYHQIHYYIVMSRRVVVQMKAVTMFPDQVHRLCHDHPPALHCFTSHLLSALKMHNTIKKHKMRNSAILYKQSALHLPLFFVLQK